MPLDDLMVAQLIRRVYLVEHSANRTTCDERMSEATVGLLAAAIIWTFVLVLLFVGGQP